MLRILLFLLMLAAIIYAIFWMTGRGHVPPEEGGTPRGPVGPDDDDDFLRELERERRRNQPPDESA